MRTRLFFKIAMQGIFTRTFALLSLVILSIISFAQDTTVYKWKYKSKKIGDRKYELIFTTDSVNGWQLYAPNQDLGGVQTVELKLADSAIAVDKEFKVDGPSKTFISPIFADTVRVYEQKAEWKATISFIDTVPAKLPGKLTYFFGKDDAFNSELLDFSVDLEGGVETITVVDIPTIDIENPVMPCGDDGTGNKSILSIFFLGLAGGLIALLTPCVFPMIPVTVSFFTKKSHARKKAITNAILYGLFIFLIYVAITIPFHVADKTISPEIFNNISTNMWLNLLFFVIFVVFAISFFGYFEIGLPAGFANKMDSKSGLGNFWGIFFYGGYISYSFVLMYRSHIRNIISRCSRTGGLATNGRCSRFWCCAGFAICFIRHVSQVASFITKVRGLDDQS